MIPEFWLAPSEDAEKGASVMLGEASLRRIEEKQLRPFVRRGGLRVTYA
jgi:hypothetical protein